MRLALAILSLLVLLAPARAQNLAACSAATTHGNYSVMCSGMISPAAGAPQVPITVLGVATAVWGGTVTGTAKASIGGSTVVQTVTGVAATNSDCTGSIRYTQKINDQPAPDLNLVVHVLDDGKEIRGMSVDAGVTMTCSLRLMSR